MIGQIEISNLLANC